MWHALYTYTHTLKSYAQYVLKCLCIIVIIIQIIFCSLTSFTYYVRLMVAIHNMKQHMYIRIRMKQLTTANFAFFMIMHKYITHEFYKGMCLYHGLQMKMICYHIPQYLCTYISERARQECETWLGLYHVPGPPGQFG